MNNKLINIAKSVYDIKNKIAFYPTIFAIGGCILSMLTLYLESLGISNEISDFFSPFEIKDLDTARSILTTFIAGLTSIMVFSFSMVMILLNQASTNFSPRLLPGLISDRKHQFVLGTYIAVIIYCIFILVFLKKSNWNETVPSFSVLFSIVLMIICLGAFIYFIHSISEGIQIDNIMFKVYEKAENKLNKAIALENTNTNHFPNTENWKTYFCKTTGYANEILENTIMKIAVSKNCKIHVLVKPGTYYKEGQPLFKVEKELESNFIDKIYHGIRFNISQQIEGNSLVAFKQLTEIGTKAMSPGINDPGTAISAIDYLSNLFELQIKKNEFDLIYHKSVPVVLVQTLSFKDILSNTFLALRTYCKHDVSVLKKIIAVLNYLLKITRDESIIKAIYIEKQKTFEDIEKNINNSKDLEYLKYLLNIEK
jgi:uncharacterized membrane protein